MRQFGAGIRWLFLEGDIEDVKIVGGERGLKGGLQFRSQPEDIFGREIRLHGDIEVQGGAGRDMEYKVQGVAAFKNKLGGQWLA